MKEPEKRPTSEELLSHPFIAQVDDERDKGAFLDYIKDWHSSSELPDNMQQSGQK